MATNAAMVLAKDAGKKPRELAEAFAERLRADDWSPRSRSPVRVSSISRSSLPPGSQALRQRRPAGRAITAKAILAPARRSMSNMFPPTRPGRCMSGHCRGAVFGDALASLLAFTGFKVTREYYVNDAGAQVDALARSAYLRYREALGRGHRRYSRKGFIRATISSRSEQRSRLNMAMR